MLQATREKINTEQNILLYAMLHILDEVQITTFRRCVKFWAKFLIYKHSKMIIHRMLLRYINKL